MGVNYCYNYVIVISVTLPKSNLQYYHCYHQYADSDHHTINAVIKITEKSKGTTGFQIKTQTKKINIE